MLKVLATGQIVKLGGQGDTFLATITAISIRRGDYVTYEVNWWDGRTRKTEWMTESEFTLDVYKAHYVPIGFVFDEAEGG